MKFKLVSSSMEGLRALTRVLETVIPTAQKSESNRIVEVTLDVIKVRWSGKAEFPLVEPTIFGVIASGRYQVAGVFLQFYINLRLSRLFGQTGFLDTFGPRLNIKGHSGDWYHCVLEIQNNELVCSAYDLKKIHEIIDALKAANAENSA